MESELVVHVEVDASIKVCGIRRSKERIPEGTKDPHRGSTYTPERTYRLSADIQPHKIRERLGPGMADVVVEALTDILSTETKHVNESQSRRDVASAILEQIPETVER